MVVAVEVTEATKICTRVWIGDIIERGIMDSDDIRAMRYRGFQPIAYALILIRFASFPLIDVCRDPAGLLRIVVG